MLSDRVLGWSFSRYDTFQYCKRQYFYQYYAKYDKEFSYPLIQELKMLQSEALCVGSAVHQIIEAILSRLLTTNRPLHLKKLKAFSRKMLQQQMQEAPFAESYYDGKEPSLDILFSILWPMVEGFVHSPRFTWIRKYAHKNSPEWVIEPPNYGLTWMGEYKAYIKPDLVIPLDGELYVFDWKTGKAKANHDRQLEIYSAWASQQFPHRKGVHTHIVYLYPSYREVKSQEPVDPSSVIASIGEETRQMYAYLEDVENNRPKPKFHFPMVEEEYRCQWCNFRQLCQR